VPTHISYNPSQYVTRVTYRYIKCSYNSTGDEVASQSYAGVKEKTLLVLLLIELGVDDLIGRHNRGRDPADP
jgi:hypothetical protein